MHDHSSFIHPSIPVVQALGTLPPNDEVPDCQGFMIELEG